MATIRKAQNGKRQSKAPVYKSPFGQKTADSTNYFRAKRADLTRALDNFGRYDSNVSKEEKQKYYKGASQALDDEMRQARKGKPGYDKYGRPVPYDKISSSSSSSSKSKKAKSTSVTKEQTKPSGGMESPIKAKPTTRFPERRPVMTEGGNRRNGGPVKAKGGKWIQKAIKKPGALRAQLGAKPGKPIAAGKLAKAAKAPGKLGQRARLAQTLKKMRKK